MVVDGPDAEPEQPLVGVGHLPTIPPGEEDGLPSRHLGRCLVGHQRLTKVPNLSPDNAQLVEHEYPVASNRMPKKRFQLPAQLVDEGRRQQTEQVHPQLVVELLNLPFP